MHEQQKSILIKELHVDHLTAHQEISDLLEIVQPEVLLMSGLTYRNYISLETMARKPIELEFIEGPSILKGAWPWMEAISSLRSCDIPAEVSEDAGQYVCESAFWSALNFRRKNNYRKMLGFIHVPAISAAWNANKIAEVMAVALQSTLHGLEFT